jgi:hypothetical protein
VGLGLAVSSALNHPEVASNNTAQTEVMFVFIIFPFFGSSVVFVRISPLQRMGQSAQDITVSFFQKRTDSAKAPASLLAVSGR